MIPLRGGTGAHPGGAGGGAIQITSSDSITITALGSVVVDGESGGSYSPMDVAVATPGGSGGAILLESPVVDVAGYLSAAGGAGGSVGPVPCGGAGASGDKPDGTVDVCMPSAGVQSDGAPGGGAGWIVVKAHLYAGGDVLSPSVKSRCAHVPP
jgi:hypothetical protein